MKLILLLTILIVSSSACGIFLPEDEYLQKQRIFNVEGAEKQRLEQYISMPFDGYWTPTQSQLDGVFETTVKYLQTTGEDNNLQEFETYRHQHFGYVSDGKQYIYNNYFCESYNIDTEWLSNFISVEDGGNCFFQTIYDVSNNEIISLYINGEA